MKLRERRTHFARHDHQYFRDCAELGDNGIPKTEIERTPWQQLWIEWVGLKPLAYHLTDWPEHVEHTLDQLERRARQTFEIARRSPAPFIVIVDNITASAIGPARFRTGRLQIQISENVPLDRWRISLPVIAEAIEAFGKP